MIIFGLGLTALNITILTRYKINYPFIFELDPNYKMTNVEIFRVRSTPYFIKLLY